MRRSLRILLDVFAVLSALLCVMTGGLWVRSATSADARREDWIFTADQPGRRPRLAVGRIEFGRLDGPPQRIVWGSHTFEQPRAPYPDVTSYTQPMDMRTVTWRWAGFERQQGRLIVQPARPPAMVDALASTSIPFTLWFVPYWFPTLVLALLPAARGTSLLRRHLRTRRRRRLGHCRRCGYDLRATPQRCPECGAVANAT
jgi:hypothetical protein